MTKEILVKYNYDPYLMILDVLEQLKDVIDIDVVYVNINNCSTDLKVPPKAITPNE